MVTRRMPDRRAYRRIRVGDVELTDDPNDDWLCISFNEVYVGDFCPNCVYVHKVTRKVKIQETSVLTRLLAGFVVCRSLHCYKLDMHHRKILETFVRDCFDCFKCKDDDLSRVSLEHVNITMTQQRV